MLRVYLAAPYQMKDFIIGRAAQLRACGIQVTSSWLNEPHSSSTKPSELPAEERRAYAIQDVADVFAADIVVFQDDSHIRRAGRHVEFGIAVAIGQTRPMPIFVVGAERANIFHFLPQVHHFSTWDETKDRLCELARIGQD
jgi:hypothetical protein